MTNELAAAGKPSAWIRIDWRQSMSVFCLVHGSTQGPSGWELLVSELKARGHDCICVDLPTDEPDAGATRYAAAIGAALAGVNKPTVVAHSASGIFLPLVPDYAPVDRLVYLAAVIPQPGESLLSQFRRAPDMFRPDWVGKDPTEDDSLAVHYLFHDCTPEVTQWALSTLRLMNPRTGMIEECPVHSCPMCPPLTSPASKIAPSTRFGGRTQLARDCEQNLFKSRPAMHLTSLARLSWRQYWIH